MRAHVAAKEHGIRLLVGARLVTTDGFEAVCYPTDRDAYGRLCRLLTAGNRRAIKGECHFSFEEMIAASEGQIFIALPPRSSTPAFAERLRTLAAAARGRVYLAATFAYRGDERRRLGELDELAAQTRAPLVATNDVLYHEPGRSRCRRAHLHPREMHDRRGRLPPRGQRRAAPEERRRDGAAVRALSRRPSRARSRSPSRIRFSLDELRYEYPDEPVPPGKTPQAYLEELTWARAAGRYPDGVPEKVRALLARSWR